jgi:aminoglycoside phosphotransferase (APT) family kinase protein
MDSLTKNRQSLPALRAMTSRAYGVDQVPPGDDWAAELGHGRFNVAYRIRLRDGRHVVLKIAPPPDVEVLTYERGAMATELAALALIRSHTSVPVPAVDFADTSRDLCGADYFFMTYLDADNFGIVRETLPASTRNACDEALGAVTRELNAIRGAAFGPLTAPRDPSWRTVFTGLVEDVLRDGRRREADLGRDYDTVRAALAEHADCLDAVTEPRFVEWDLWDNNVMIRDGRIVGIIDHERAFYGDPLIEAGFVATELPAFGNPAAFRRGYGVPTPTPDERRRLRLYALHRTLVMVVETAYRGHPGTRRHAWARARLTEALHLLAVHRRP